MSIGQMRHRITIEQLSAAQDGLGQPVRTWNAVATAISADVRYLSGLQAIKADATTSVVNAATTPGLIAKTALLVFCGEAVNPPIALEA